MKKAQNIAVQHFAGRKMNPEQLDNFNASTGLSPRPGYTFREVFFNFNVDNNLTARKDLTICPASFTANADLGTAGITSDGIITDGEVITDLSATASDAKLTNDHFTAWLRENRLLVTQIEIESDTTAQFAEKFVHVKATPFVTDKQTIINIKPYKSPNQTSTSEVKMVLKTKGQEFWMGPDDVVTVGIAKSSDSNFRIVGLAEVPA